MDCELDVVVTCGGIFLTFEQVLRKFFSNADAFRGSHAIFLQHQKTFCSRSNAISARVLTSRLRVWVVDAVGLSPGSFGKKVDFDLLKPYAITKLCH